MIESSSRFSKASPGFLGSSLGKDRAGCFHTLDSSIFGRKAQVERTLVEKGSGLPIRDLLTGRAGKEQEDLLFDLSLGSKLHQLDN
ncbi:MAG TPA: hypothetical protein PKD55_24210, partial [Bellilinea sp.]|nr:hypothetical protein [Bellilinea sp.]